MTIWWKNLAWMRPISELSARCRMTAPWPITNWPRKWALELVRARGMTSAGRSVLGLSGLSGGLAARNGLADHGPALRHSWTAPRATGVCDCRLDQPSARRRTLTAERALQS